LRCRDARDSRQRGSTGGTGGQMQKCSTGKFHGIAPNNTGSYSPLMFAALRIGHHFSISAFC
jgi:hypothetical protein